MAPSALPPADLLPVGRRANFPYRAVRLVALPVLRLFFRFQVEGREHIPRFPSTPRGEGQG
jgi:1-acyl-sn-glycerol-3-phosphate acyltransferase